MYPITNGAPRAILHGINDQSGRPPVYEGVKIPTHLPHVFIYAERGTPEPQYVVGDSLVSMYGRKSFDPRGKYYNHQTALLEVVNGNGNLCLVQRIIPEDAGPKARLLLSLDIVEEPQVELYERNTDGSYKLDPQGAKIKKNQQTTGYKARWVLNDWTVGLSDQDAFGQVRTQAGSLQNSNSDASQLYPIMEFEVQSQGAYGNNVGLRISAPTANAPFPANTTVANRLNAFLYRLQLVERADDKSTPKVVPTIFGDQMLDFCLKPDAVNHQTDQDLNLKDIFLRNYQNLDQVGFPPQYGPFGRIHIYEQNLREILTKIGVAESSHNTLPLAITDENSEGLYAVNIFTGVNINNVPYHSLELEGPITGGLRFTENATHYATGGSDGTMSFEAFAKAVGHQCENYGELEYPFMDDALYQQSVIYDSGFDLDTKKQLLTVIGRRKDMAVILSTQDVSAPQNSASAESSIAIALRAAARLMPESTIFGTPVCRAQIMGHSGYLIQSKYQKLLPLTLELADKYSRYMGAANGIWKSGKAFDMPPNNHLKMFRDVNIVYKNEAARSRDWDNGLVWAQNYDFTSRFIPAFQTVYDDDTSTLNSARTMWVAIELEKVAQRTWRDLTGITLLTKEQFIERSDRLIAERTVNRFDVGTVVTPETYFTSYDEQRGYSWSCKIHMENEVMRTVGQFEIVAHRRGEFAN